MIHFQSKARMLTLCALFTALIAVGAFLRIPTPLIPITTQTMFVLMAGMLLGGQAGFASVCAYLILGLVGLPIFAAGGGLTYVFQPTFGYLIGFALGALVTGQLAGSALRPSYPRLICASLAGLAVIYVCGLLYWWALSTFYLGTGVALRVLLMNGFLLTLPSDLLTGALAIFLCRRIRPILWAEAPASTL